jgi:hypothetical protein
MEVAHEAQIWWVHGDLPTLPHEVLDRGIHPGLIRCGGCGKVFNLR